MVISRALLGVCSDGNGKLKLVVVCSCTMPDVPALGLEVIVRSSFAFVSRPLKSSIRLEVGPELVFGLSTAAPALLSCAGLCDLENLLLNAENDVTGGRNSVLISCKSSLDNGVTFKMGCLAATPAWAIMLSTLSMR